MAEFENKFYSSCLSQSLIYKLNIFVSSAKRVYDVYKLENTCSGRIKRHTKVFKRLGVDHCLLLIGRFNVNQLLHQQAAAFTVTLGVMHETQVAVPANRPYVG